MCSMAAGAIDDLISYANACCLNNERSNNDVIPLNLLTLYQQARTDRNCNLATLWTSHFAFTISSCLLVKGEEVQRNDIIIAPLII
jgi:hypothetical protein